MRRALAATLLLLAGLAVPGAAPHDAAAAPPHPVSWSRFNVTVDNETAYGWLAYPTDVAPTTLLVVAHGCCVNLLGSWGESAARYGWGMEAIAAKYGAAVVGMDYRGPGHFDVWTGHRDTNAATEDLQARWGITRTILWGGSMGGEVSGMALAARPDLYDYWVDVYGVMDLLQEFPFFAGPYVTPQADLANPTGSWILEETGGLPGVAPLSAWEARSPLHRAAEMVGVRHAYICHGVGDPYVPVTQSLEMAAALRANGIPVSLMLTTTAGTGGIQGPYLPNYGPTGVNPVDGTPGPAGHDIRGGVACSARSSATVVTQLLLGNEPDAGVSRLHVVDYILCYLETQPPLAGHGLPCQVDLTLP